jgi:hypothetical protein
MSTTYRAKHPNDLRSILESHNAGIEHSNGDSNSACHIEIALLQPLSDPSLVESSRNFINRYGNEYLNLTSLGKAWREEWVDFLKAQNASHLRVSFDATMPEYQNEDGSVRGLWFSVDDHNLGKGKTGLHVIDREFACLLYVLGTQARMLTTGKLELRVMEQTLSGWGVEGRLGLQKRLTALSRETSPDE